MLFKKEDAPRYGPGFTTVVVTSVASILLGFFYRFLCIYSNRKRDKEGHEENFENAYEDDFTDRTVRDLYKTRPFEPKVLDSGLTIFSTEPALQIRLVRPGGLAVVLVVGNTEI